MHEEFINEATGALSDRYTPPYAVGEVLCLRNSTPRCVQVVLDGKGDEAVKWWGLASDEVYALPGTILKPIVSEGEDPASGAFKYLYTFSIEGKFNLQVKK